MKYVWEATVLAHHEFGKVVFKQLYDSEEKAYTAMQEQLAGFKTSCEPEWVWYYEGYVYCHSVK